MEMNMFQLNEEQTSLLVDQVKAASGEKTLILVRGLPGLGKSTLGRKICSVLDGIQIENDMQFMVSGEYVFDPSKLEDAHAATQVEVKNLMVDGAPCVVVSNTFTRQWEMAAYREFAAKYQYTLIEVDLLLAVRTHAQSRPEPFSIGKFLDFLNAANVHMVPPDKIHSMFDRYELAEDVITVSSPADNASMDVSPRAVSADGPVTLNNPACPFKLLDTGYYLALDLTVAEGATAVHSHFYQRCIDASQEILKVFGVSCGYRMLRKLTTRNSRSHGMCYAMQKQAALTQQPCTNPHANARNAAKLAAGWTRYHVTLLSPSEYTLLKHNDTYLQFVMFLEEIDFRPLLQSTGETSSVSECAFPAMGVQRGTVTEMMPFQLDAPGAEAGLSEKEFSTTVYLLLDPACAAMQALAAARVQCGLGGGVDRPEAESNGNAAPFRERWQPHITLAFTHNDIRADPSNPETWDKLDGVARYQSLVQKMGLLSAEGAAAGRAVTTDLVEDTPQHSLAALLLYTEVQASFRLDQFGFTVVDVKVRKGAMGDDATYRAHPYLQAYLPRGLVYVQHQASRVIYRGLFSLRKFYGKEGVEDDGIGIGATQMKFKLDKVLDHTDTILCMEKVNGRAASCRFFTAAGELLVIVGTKLSHVLCRVDVAAQRLVMPTASAAETAGSPEDAEDELDASEQVSDKRGDERSNTASPVVDTSDRGPQAMDLIQSNVTALQSNLRWDRVPAFVAWLAGRTFNGEVLDPAEMHLVVIEKHEWMSLCVTDFITPGETASGDVSSALQDMLKLGEYTHCVPAYDSYDVTMPPSAGTSEAAVNARAAKRARLTQITDTIVHARESEGKVLYFLDPSGKVLELLKFKTWWYIWRRSIRELTSQLFSRYYKTSHRGQRVDQDTSEEDRLRSMIEQFDRIYQQMQKAKPEARASDKFRARLDEVTSKLNQHRSQLDKLALRKSAEPDYDVTFTAIELCAKVQRKWPTKFAFFQAELGGAYGVTVERVCEIAQKFLHWSKVQFKEEKDAFYRAFKEEYPVVWRKFLQQTGESDEF